MNNGLYSLEVNRVLLDTERSDIVYAATARGVFKSIDGGQLWSETSRGLSPVEVWALAMDPQKSNVIYAGTRGEGLYVTEDGGNSWRRTGCCGTGAEESHIFSIAFDPTDPGTLLVGTGRGLFEVKYLGESFARIDGTYFDQMGREGGYGGVSALAINPRDPLTLLAAEEAGRDIYRSTDGGKTWEFVGPRRRIEQWVHSYGMAIRYDPLDANRVYYSSLDGLLVSRDDGLKWPCLSVLPEGCRTSASHLHAMAINPSDNNVMFVGTGSNKGTKEENNVYKTVDGGKTWVKSSGGLPQEATTHIVHILIDPQNENTLYLATTDQFYPGREFYQAFGVYKSNDGGSSWQAVNKGLGNLAVNSLVFHPEDSKTLYAGTQGGLYVSGNGAEGWEKLTDQQPVADAPVRSIAILSSQPHVIFASVGDSGVWVSQDSGRTWEQAVNNMCNFVHRHSFCTRLYVWNLVLDPHEKFLYATGLAGFTVFRAALPGEPN